MSSITTDRGVLHYEVYGRGKPVILLHGWLGSWGLWQESMTYLGRYYRTYAVDFWGFGESGKKQGTYSVSDFVSLVDQFMEQLGIASAPLVGHSMGGTVGLAAAITIPHRVEKVTVVGSPIEGKSLALPLKFAGLRPIAWLLFHFMGLFRATMRLASPHICRDPRFSEMMDRGLSQTTLQSFLTSIASLRRTNLSNELIRIKIPVMGMFGERDRIVSPGQWRALQKGIPEARIERFKKSGHFIMLDDPDIFRLILKEFLDTP
ncbi:MAG TPA: alpha/beta hydrolase, partial [Longilinea sp.]|nr:alpha/beta hydrolase [Longilinea sp.]